MSAGEEMVEVELTDLLAQSHEQALSLQRSFGARMDEAERVREAQEQKHTKEMHTLQQQVASSRSAMEQMKQDLLEDTTRKLNDMQSAVMASQRAIEAGVKEQARYWKSICQELVAEKRDMAQKVAEERGKYTALKVHIASHNDAAATAPTRSIACTTRREELVDMRLNGLPSSPVLSCHSGLASGNQTMDEDVSPCFPERKGDADSTSASSTPTNRSSRMVVVPSSSCVGGPPSAKASPTHSSSSSLASKSSFRRYYLAQKRDSRMIKQ
ncbi:hypothetical protein BBJ28_00011868 [Nothophytophthora sp. Chile5]|nr:hypothetical protein BBJ28_00011868 [Nothophytophthora sp. Chile5]